MKITDADSSFLALVEALPVGIVVHRDRRILYANRVCLSALGIEPDQLVGRDPIELLAPGDREKHAQRLIAVTRGESVQPTHTRLITRGGKSYEIEVTGLRVEFEGQPAVATVIHDVTAERQAQAALAESEARKKAMLSAALEAIVSMDEKGLIVGFNPAAEKIFGYSRADVLGKPLHEVLIPPSLREAHRAGLARYLSTGAGPLIGKRVELAGMRADGSEFPLELAILRVDVDGGPPLFTAFMRDLTEHKELERIQVHSAALQEENRRILEVNRLKTEFLASVSHELRTPLNAIVGFADLFHSGDLGPLSQRQRDALCHVLSSARHMVRLISDMLDLAKVESGKMEFHHELVEVRDVISEVVGIFGPVARRKTITIVTDLDPAVAQVMTDPARLRQVLFNYLSNAVKFTGEGGRVTVRTHAEGELVRLEVEDNGIGIRPQDLGRLFVAFQQLDAGLSKNYEGTGMGLALTKRIVEAQQGLVGVRSELGRGSIFYATLPRGSIACVTTQKQAARQEN
jgi:PAS domain S-box-containing protein